MKPTKGQKQLRGYNKAARFLYPIFSVLLRDWKLTEIGKAMIYSVKRGYDKNVLEIADIKLLSKE